MSMIKASVGLAAALACIHVPVSAAEVLPEASMIRFDKTCPSGGDKQALGAALLGVILVPLVQAGIEGLGGALSKAGAKKDVHKVAYGGTSFYEVTVSDVGTEAEIASSCIVLAFGPIGGKDLPSFDDMGMTEAVIASLKNAGFASAPAVYLEAEIEVTPDRTAFRLRPTNAWVGDPIGLRGAASKVRDLALTFSFMTPGPSDDATAVASRTIVVKNAQTRHNLDVPELNRLPSSWMPLPPVPNAVLTRIGEATKRLSDRRQLSEVGTSLSGVKLTAADASRLATIKRQLLELDKSIKNDLQYLAAVAPLNVRIDLHETRDGNAVLTKIGGFLTGNAAGLAQPITDTIDPTKRRAAQAKNLEEAVTAVTAESTLRIAAINEVEALQAALANANSTAAQKRVAQLKAETACRELELRRFADPVCVLLVQ